MDLKARPSPRFKILPLVAVTAAFILGITFSHFCPVKIIYLSVLASLLFLLALVNLKKKFLSDSLLLFTVFSLAALNYQRVVVIPQDNISRIISDKPRDIWLKGRVYSGIEIINIPGRLRKTAFILKTLAIEEDGAWRPVSGKLKASLLVDRADFEFGDVLVLRGKISRAEDDTLKGGFSYREYLENQGIHGLLKINPDYFTVIRRSKNILKYIFCLKEKFREIIKETLPYPQRAILTALIIGDRVEIPKEINNTFVRTGTIHILAISGLHVGLISYIFYLFLRILRIPRRISYAILIFMLMGYALLTGGSSPVVRSTIMGIAYIGGFLLLRRHQILNSLALSCLLILIFKPQQLFNAGFQLSFLSILSIIMIVPLLERWFRSNKPLPKDINNAYSRFGKINHYILELVIVSCAAWIGIIPIVGYYFKIITPVAIVANIFIIPLSFLILTVGFLTLLANLVSHAVTQIISNANLLCISLLIKVSDLLNKIPLGSIDTGIFSFPLIFVYYITLAVVFMIIEAKLLLLEKKV